VTDPQQAMMQMMMNFMPLMVVVFGWTFPAGVVLYWVAQSVYSVIQQWFITGWGAVGDWFPWLPELPDHRRLGYKKPQEANVVVSGEPAQLGGVMGWMQRKAGEMEEKKAERGGARGGTKTAATIADEEPEDTYEYDEEESFEPEPADGVIRVRASGGKVKRTGGTLVQKSTVNESAVEQTSNGASSRPKPVPRRQRGGKRKAAGG
jgi:hypothetical protein